MKGYGLLFAASLLAALTGVLYWSNHRKAAESDIKISADAPPKILDLKLANISKVDIKKKGSDQVELAKDGSGVWQIVSPKQYRADQNDGFEPASALASLSSERLLEANVSNPAQYGLVRAGYRGRRDSRKDGADA